MSRTIFFDVDGVLLDWTGPFLKYVNAPISQDQITDYQMTKTGLWLDTDAFMFDLKAFELTNEWQNLPALCQMTSLEALVNDGFTLRALTMCGHTPEVKARRVFNLARRFGPVFSSVQFVQHNESKVKIVWEHSLGDSSGYRGILVEDKGSTLLECADFNVRAMGIRQPYNVADQLKPSKIGWFTSVDQIAMQLITENHSEWTL